MAKHVHVRQNNMVLFWNNYSVHIQCTSVPTAASFSNYNIFYTLIIENVQLVGLKLDHHIYQAITTAITEQAITTDKLRNFIFTAKQADQRSGLF